MYNIDSGAFGRRKNEDLKNVYNNPSICQFIRSERTEWSGRVWRAEGVLIREVLVENPIEKRPLGRSRQRWFDTVKRGLCHINNTFRIDTASDRDQWTRIVEAEKDLNNLYYQKEKKKLSELSKTSPIYKYIFV